MDLFIILKVIFVVRIVVDKRYNFFKFINRGMCLFK